MAEDLRVNIIVDATQAERALRGVEAEAAKVTNSMKGIGTAAQQMSQGVASATNAAIGDMRRLGNEAERAAAKVAAANRAYTSGVNARGINAGPSPFPAATGGGFTGAEYSFGGIGAGLGGFGAGAGISAAIYGQVSAANSYNERVQSYYSPQAIGLADQGPLAAAKTLGVDASRAYDQYASALGKTAAALSLAEQKQAVFNAAVGKGADLVAQSNAYRSTSAGRYQTLKDTGGRAVDALGNYALGTAFTGPLGGLFNPGVYADSYNIFRGGDYATRAGGGDFSGIAGGLSASYGGIGAGIGGFFGLGASLLAQRQARLAGFDESARLAGNAGFFGAGDVSAYNQSQYGSAAARYRAQLAGAQGGYLGGVNNLVSLENLRGRFNESLQFNPGEGYTGTSTVFGESAAERTARVFAEAGRFSDPAQRRAYLAAAANGLDPASLSSDQRDTIRQALDQSIVDQIAELGKQTQLLALIEKHLANAEKKATGGPGHEYDADPTPTTTVVVTNASDTDVVSSIRFADAPPNTFTNTADTLAQDNY